jgi:UDP-hydrolysing UDP-N-acetyl-D-glucosamine 2-epimerase
MNRKVTVFTGTRAEYGLLYWLLKDIQNDDELTLQLLVSGTHLSPEFGLTYQQIESDGFVIDEKIEALLSSDTPVGVAKSMGLGVIGFSDALARLKPDIIVVLGDRFEALALTQVAMVLRIPIVHLHGGEITEGAYDDAIRHAITKLSTYHVTCTDVYKDRVIQLGESPDRVFNYGAVGLEYLRRTKLLERDALFFELDLNVAKPFFLVTYHPVTLENEPPVETFNALLSSLDSFCDAQVVITYPNSDDGGRELIALIDIYAKANPERVRVFKSLGQLRYFSALKYCLAVIGNSSSGISEVPYFKKGTVNIGTRQKGRLAPGSVVDCGVGEIDIKNSISRVIDTDFRRDLVDSECLFGDGHSAGKIIELIKSCSLKTVKVFYDL